MFDEKALRRPDWLPGVPVKLGDGQIWELRKPRIRWYPQIAGDAVTTRGSSPDLGPECDELLGVFFGDFESDTIDFPSARFHLAIRLLCANYDVGNEHLRELLFVEQDDESNRGMWSDICRRDRRPLPKTYTRYLKLAYEAGTGRRPRVMQQDDLREIVGMLVMTGRVPPPWKWVESQVAQEELNSLESIF